MSAPLIAVQRRTVGVLAGAQLLGGVGNGAALSIGSLLAVDLSGSEAWAGSITTVLTLAAAFTALPMATLAARRGRRISLVSCLSIALLGAVLMILAASLRSFPLLLLGGIAMGLSTTANLQSRFAATDLASPQHRGRDLSIVVWATTVGAVTGPNLVKAGAQLGSFFGLPEMAGPFLFSAAALLCAITLLSLALRPDPLRLAQRSQALTARSAATPSAVGGWPGRSLRTGLAAIRTSPRALMALLAVIGSHVVMVSVMSMTPLHLQQLDAHSAMGHHGTDVLAVIGFSISLHIAGMFALSPLFGWLSDRFGRLQVIAAGQLLLLGSAAIAGFGQQDSTSVTVGLVLLGLGWSASTIAGATLLSESVAPESRVLTQGVSDTLMGFTAAIGSILAGLALAYWGYSGLNLIAALLVLAVLLWLALVSRATRFATAPVE
ncbi:MFS transporter [Psychromicrobium lacuslunae]|uniref:MFS transporter n=1 Tax=Psychromicrobium lacuslunae TaxID=1618207 RepID=A0A0D4C367_9MICC|nr:MFS transporter [Psychromicrobium lacuslunae]